MIGCIKSIESEDLVDEYVKSGNTGLVLSWLLSSGFCVPQWECTVVVEQGIRRSHYKRALDSGINFSMRRMCIQMERVKRLLEAL